MEKIKTQASDLKEALITSTVELVNDIKAFICSGTINEVNVYFIFASDGRIMPNPSNSLCDTTINREVIKTVAKQNKALGVLFIKTFSMATALAESQVFYSLKDKANLILASFLETYFGDYSQLTYFQNTEMVYETENTHSILAHPDSLLPKLSSVVQA